MGSPTQDRHSRQTPGTGNALELEPNVFSMDNPRRIAESLKRSAEKSQRRRAEPFRSAMSMLTFYINKEGGKLPSSQVERLEQAKDELRELFGRPRRDRPNMHRIDQE